MVSLGGLQTEPWVPGTSQRSASLWFRDPPSFRCRRPARIRAGVAPGTRYRQSVLENPPFAWVATLRR